MYVYVDIKDSDNFEDDVIDILDILSHSMTIEKDCDKIKLIAKARLLDTIFQTSFIIGNIEHLNMFDIESFTKFTKRKLALDLLRKMGEFLLTFEENEELLIENY